MKVEVNTSITKAVSFSVEETNKLVRLLNMISYLSPQQIIDSFGYDRDFGNSRCVYETKELQEIFDFVKSTLKQIENSK